MKFFVDLLAELMDRAWAHAQSVCDFFIQVTFRQQFQGLPFARSQRVELTFRIIHLPKIVRHLRCHLRVERNAPGVRVTNGFQNLEKYFDRPVKITPPGGAVRLAVAIPRRGTPAAPLRSGAD